MLCHSRSMLLAVHLLGLAVGGVQTPSNPTGVAPDLPLEVPGLEEPSTDDIMVVDPDTSGFDYIKSASQPSMAPGGGGDLAAAIKASLLVRQEEQQEEQQRRAALQDALSQAERGAVLNTTTPADGHCLFHALRHAGVGSVQDVPCSLTVQELRAMALSSASPEDLAVAAAGTGEGISVDEYVRKMRSGAWGDNLMVSQLARVFARSITIVRPDSVRTFTAAGNEFDGPDPDAAWVAHFPEVHYYGIHRATLPLVADEPCRRQALGLIREDCELCTAAFTCMQHAAKSQTALVVSKAPAGLSLGSRGLVIRRRLRVKTVDPGWCKTPEQERLCAPSQKQLKTCSRCGQAGHRMDSLKCPMRGKPWPEGKPRPRWLPKKATVKAKAGSRAALDQRTPASRVRILQRILAKQQLTTRRPVVERPAWAPSYTAPPSPGKASQRRIDRRRVSKPYEVLEGDEGAARAAMVSLGLVWSPDGRRCLKCQAGRYAPYRTRPDMFRCSRAKCRDHRSLWKGSAWWNSGMSVRRSYNLAVGFSARLSPTQASLDKGLKLDVVIPYWRYFRGAMAHRGLQLRSNVWFSGTAEDPCHVELDETVVKKVRIFKDGERVGTMHHALFAMVQRNSRKAVIYLLEPRPVPIRSDNGAGSSAPPPSVEEILPFLQRHVGDWCILHTDRARAYPGLLETILADRKNVYMDSVNHGQHQWTCFCRHIVDNHPTMTRLRVIAGTQLVEALWHVIKSHQIPKEIRANAQEIEAYALSYLAQRWELKDPLEEFGKTVQDYICGFSHDPWTHDQYLHGAHADDGEETGSDDEVDDAS